LYPVRDGRVQPLARAGQPNLAASELDGDKPRHLTRAQRHADRPILHACSCHRYRPKSRPERRVGARLSKTPSPRWPARQSRLRPDCGPAGPYIYTSQRLGVNVRSCCRACGPLPAFAPGTAAEILAGRLTISPWPAVRIDPPRRRRRLVAGPVPSLDLVSDLSVRQLDRGFDRAVPGRRPGRGRVLGLGQGPAAELATGWPPSRPAPPDLDLLAGGLSGPGLDRGPDSAHGRLPGRALAANLGSWAQARPADPGHRMRLPGRRLRRAGPDVEAGGPPADARLVRAQPARPGR